MGTFVRDTATSLFLPGIKRVLNGMIDSYNWFYKKFCHVVPSSQRQEKYFYMYNGVPLIPQKAEGDTYQYGDIVPGSEWTITNLTYGYGLRYSLEAQEDELYGQLKKFPKHLSDAEIHTLEVIGHAPLNNGFTTNGYDGVPLFSLVHPANDGAVRANRPATDADISYVVLSDAKKALMVQQNYVGHYSNWKGGMAVYNPANDDLWQKLLNTKGEPWSSDNTINYVEGMVKPCPDPYFTDTNGWAILPAPYEDGILLQMRVNPKLSESRDADNEDFLVRMRFRCASGVLSYGNTYGSSGVT